MASKDTDDSDESVVRAFEDVIKFAAEKEKSAPKGRRLSSYSDDVGALEQGLEYAMDQPLNVEQSVVDYDFTKFQYGRTASKKRLMKYDQEWDEASAAEGNSGVFETQSTQLVRRPVPRPHPIANQSSGAVLPADSKQSGNYALHFHLTKKQTVINSPAVTVGGDVKVSPDYEEDEASRAIIRNDMQIIRCETQRKYEEWTEGMVLTEATKIITDMIAQGRTWVTVTGGPGEGKTTTAYMALRSLHNLGRQVYDIHCPEDYFKVKGSRWPVLMLNDIFGESHFDDCNLAKWRTVLNDILAMKEHRDDIEAKDDSGVRARTIRGERYVTVRKRVFQPCVILVSRSCVLASASQYLGRFKDLIYAPDVVVDLTGNKKCSPEERMLIWKYHAGRYGISMDNKIVREFCAMSLPYGFPHCCRLFAGMYSKNQNLCMKTFFQKPLEFLNQSMESYMSNPIFGQLLREMLRQDGSIHLDYISESNRHYQFTSAVNQLKGVLLQREGDLVKFLHPSIHDSASFIMCRDRPMFIVTRCTLSFINDRVRFSGLKGKGISEIELIATIDRKYTEEFIKRLKYEIECNNIQLSLCHESFHDEEFCANFMDCFLPEDAQTRSECVRELIHRRDALSGQSFLFLSTISKSDKLLRSINKIIKLSLEEHVDALFGICQHSSVTSMHYFLSEFEYMDLNKKNAESQTPLLVCSTKGSEEMIKLLLERNVDVCATDQDGNSALHHICDTGVDGDGTVVKMLIDKGASANTESQIYPFIPLHLACVRGHVNVVRALLDSGTNVNAVDLWGDTPLHASSVEGHVSVVTALLEQGGDSNTQNTWGDTPLYLASLLGHTNVVKTLLHHGTDANLKTSSGDTPLCAASDEGNTGVVQALIDERVDISIQGSKGDTAIYLACISGHPNIVTLLLDHGADANTITNSGDTLLCAASARKHVGVIHALFIQGADINQRNKQGDTPLCVACACGNANVVMALLLRKANINRTDEIGSTPLHIACAVGHTDVVKLLLERGADTSLTDAKGYTPMDTANNSKHYDIVDILKRRSSSIC